MGCHKYTVAGHINNGEWGKGSIMFSEVDDTLTCLCTTHEEGGDLGPEEIRSMAYLGAAVIFQHQRHQDWRVLPGGIPEWVREAIDKQFAAGSAAQTKEKP